MLGALLATEALGFTSVCSPSNQRERQSLRSVASFGQTCLRPTRAAADKRWHCGPRDGMMASATIVGGEGTGGDEEVLPIRSGLS